MDQQTKYFLVGLGGLSLLILGAATVGPWILAILVLLGIVVWGLVLLVLPFWGATKLMPRRAPAPPVSRTDT